MRTFKILILFIILIPIIFISFKLKTTILNTQNILFENFNFQGIECIDNEIYLISNFDSKIYKINEKFELQEFLDTAIVYKNKYIFSHATSFYIKDKIFYGVNSMANMNGVMVVAKIDNIKKNMKLSELEYEAISLKTNINHLEYFSNGEQILLKHSQSTNDNKNLIKIYINEELKCEIENNLVIQNIYYDKRKNEVLLISNLLKHYFGIIYYLPLKTICNNEYFNFFNINNKKLIISPFYELEGYTLCNNKEYFVYINNKDSRIYIK